MAFDQYLAERITISLIRRKASFETKKMMGGLCFMVESKMACGIHYDKKRSVDLLMARVGPDQYEVLLKRDHVYPMDFTGRPMKGYVFVTPDGFDQEEDLEFWLDQIMAFNPFAKASKKKSKKT